MIDNQTNIFEMLYETYKITKPIRLITLFSGYDSQALALKYLGVKFEHYKTCEWAIKSIQALKDLHFEEDNIDYSKELSTNEIKEYLFNKGISSNYNDPMSKEQVSRLNKKQVRTIYNNIKATHNLVNIQQVKGDDLCIKDTDNFTYLLTYSFPCQDLSLAGKGKGMSDTTTRSGMLWEVERILTECEEKPQILLMENVPQVHGEGNKEDFNKWQFRLEELGYKNYWQDLIATDYGIPQTRNRCFMISILGEYNYTFPKPTPLKLKLKDMLEENVDDKYYLSEAMIKYIVADNEAWTGNNNEALINKTLASTLNTSEGSRRCDASNYISNQFEDNCNLKKIISYGTYYTWEDKKGNINTQCNRAADENKNALTIACANPGNVLIKNNTKKGYLEAHEGDCIDLCQPGSQTRRGRVQKQKSQTITTMGGEHLGVCIGTYQYSKSDKFMQGKDRFQIGKEVSDTLQTSQKEGIVNSDLRIRKLTPKECFRLMGVKDEDYDKVKKKQSDSSLYHLAGDSLVTLVFCAIMSTMIDNCKTFEQVLEEFYLQISS